VLAGTDSDRRRRETTDVNEILELHTARDEKEDNR
jgi:hypothetical protein